LVKNTGKIKRLLKMGSLVKKHKITKNITIVHFKSSGDLRLRDKRRKKVNIRIGNVKAMDRASMKKSKKLRKLL